MAGESAQFGLRNRPPTPAIRPFDLPPRMTPMLDRAKSGLAEPFHGITTNGGIVPGLFAIEKTGVSPSPLMEAARSFLAALTPEQRQAATFAIGDEALAEMVEHPPLADAAWYLPGRSQRQSARDRTCSTA
jgi:hypothetical protein